MLPVTMPLFLDQTTITTAIKQSHIMKSKVKEAQNQGWLRKSNQLDRRTGYQSNWYIYLGKNSKQPIFSVRPVKPGCRFSRISFNPQGTDLNLLRKRLKFLYGADFKEIYYHGSVTRTDTTVDIYGYPLNNMFFYAKGFLSSKNHGFGDMDGHHLPASYISNITTRGVRTGLTIGSKDSDTTINIYDKRLQKIMTSLKHVDLDQDWVRIEIRYRRTGLTIPELHKLPNKFSKIEVYSKHIAREKLNPLFLLACQNGCVSDALQCLERNERDRHKYALEKHRVHWFNADTIWKGLPEALEVLEFLKP